MEQECYLVRYMCDTMKVRLISGPLPYTRTREIMWKDIIGELEDRPEACSVEAYPAEVIVQTPDRGCIVWTVTDNMKEGV